MYVHCAFKKHNSTQLILKSVMLAFEGIMFFQKHTLSFLFYFPITFNEYPEGAHQVSHENFTLCKTLEGKVFA